MKSFICIFVVCVLQAFAASIPDSPSEMTSEIQETTVSGIRDLKALISSTNTLLNNLPKEISEKVTSVINEGSAFVSSLPKSGSTGIGVRAASDVLNNLKETVDEQLGTGALAVKEKFSKLFHNANSVLVIADQQINEDADAAVATIEAAIAQAGKGATVQCLYKVMDDLRTRTDRANEVILSCMFRKMSEAKDLISGLARLVGSCNEPLSIAVAALKPCASATPSASTDINKAKCLLTSSGNILTTEEILGLEIYSKLSLTLSSLEGLGSDVPSCATKEFVDNIIVAEIVKSAVEAC